MLAADLGVTHAADLGFVFGSIAPLDEVDLYDPDLPTVRRVAHLWSRTQCSFARHGHPDRSLPEWPTDLPNRACAIVDDPMRVDIDIDADRQRIWGDRDTT